MPPRARGARLRRSHLATNLQKSGLKRSLTLPLLTLYGLGVTVGAGIYVLIGATAAQAGAQAWLAFVIAALVAGCTAFSYAELSTRFPVSAGEAAYVTAGFGRAGLATLVGGLVAMSGLVSASAITVGASGYLHALTGVPATLLIVGIVAALAMLALWGIKQSVMVAGTITVLEILGLVFVIIWGGFVADHAGAAPADLIPSLDLAVWSGILGATVLAFFAYIGFEDMVNVAEEVENPRRTMPLAIIVTLFVATVLYCAVSISVLIAVPVESLATSHAPLTLVFATAPSQIQLLFAALAVVATVNGVLIQMIMVSRVLYGMADQGNLPNVLARLSERTQTPTVATGLVAAGILVLSLFLPVEQLAEWTSQIVLTVFVFINMSLIAIKRQGDQKGDHFRVPILLPVFGALTSAALLVASLF